MPDERTNPRVPLRALDWPPDPGRADRVVGEVMRHIAARPPRGESVLEALAPYLRPALATAAMMVVAAVASLAAARGPEPAADRESAIARWAEDGHVPTNGELLAAFQGYAP